MKFTAILLINILFVPVLSYAIDYETRPEVNWTSDSNVDFCANANTFDFRNAYWLGALSYYSYWHVKYANPIVASHPEVILDLPFAPDKNSTTFDIHGMGFGKLRSIFFSSAPALPEADGESSNLVRTWQPSLPFEACIKPNRFFCFGGEGPPVSSDNNKKSQAEMDICGNANVNAFFENSRLKNIQALVLGLPLTQKTAEQAARDKKYIENLVSKYEHRKGVKVNLNWLDKTTPQRCDFFKSTEQDLPDTQAGIFESEEAITIAVRGTEPGNESDIRTDLMSFNQVDLSESLSRTGSVHKGFYKAAFVMKNWLFKELAKIRSSPKSAKKPIFITGHSLGGALANIIMYSLLEHNNSKRDPNLRLNLKALYTFGAPRVGDHAWAKRFRDLGEQMDVGLYRLVNFSDPVPNAPCLNYSHAGALVYMDPYSNGYGKAIDSVKVLLNPLNRVLNLGTTHINLANCAYETALYYPLHIQEMVNSHFMTSYYQSLSFLRNSLNKKLQTQGKQAILNGDYKTAEQLNYPLNCQKPNISNLNLDGVELNYQLLKSELED